MRAFKHAIFGTPDTVQAKPRRHSNTEATRPRQPDSRPSRPNMMRPNSAGDARGLIEENEPLVPEAVVSPTKGILMTPGTAAARRKTVSFGDGVVNNEEKRPIKSGLPDDCPGKYPSPWGKPKDSDEEVEVEVEPPRSGRTKLTEQLEKARDESAKRKKKHKHGRDDVDSDVPKEFADPKSEAGKYWKAQYDVYRENTQREVKKLITKQKAAKGYARDKDFACTDLADQLRQEKKKVDRLEKSMQELQSQLKEAQAKLRSQQGDQSPKMKLESFRSQPELAKRSDAPTLRGTQPERQSRHAAPLNPQRAEQKAPEHPLNRHETAKKADPVQPTDLQARAKHRPNSIRTASNDDIWAQSFNSSAVAQERTADNTRLSPGTGRAVTSGTGLTPLQSLSINTLPTEQMPRRDSAQPSPPAERTSKPTLVRQTSKPSPGVDDKFASLPLLSPSIPAPSVEPAREDVRKSPEPRKQLDARPRVDARSPVQASSPFQPDVTFSPPDVTTTKRKDSERALVGPREPGNTKENISPISTKQTDQQTEPSAKPSAAWTAINAPGVGKRTTSVVAKDGKEMEMSRVEAAKARIAARGRVVS